MSLILELMDQVVDLQALPKGTTIALGATAVVLGRLFLWLINRYFQEHRRRRSTLPAVPEVPGRLPVIGNALQLREKKPHMTFVKWVKTYGPIFSIRVGSKSIVVLNNNDVAKEAMVTRFSSISTRKLPKALSMLTSDKCMVALSDYDDFHKTLKRHIIKNVLGPNAQKRHRCHRDTMIANIVKDFHAHVKNNGIQPVNFRNVFQSELFALAMKETVGSDVQSIYVEELGRLSKHEIFGILFKDLVEAALDVDWREFFPYLKWIPNKTLERRIEKLNFRRQAVMIALIKEQSKRVTSEEEMNCYLNYLLREGKELTEKQIAMLLWEVILLSSDTTMVTSEWAMFELAKNPKLQDRLYQEVQSICGSDKITEEMLCQLPYLEAVFHETLRKYPPIPIPFLRFAHEDTEIGGYYIPAGTEIAINFYGCNMDENQWEKPEEWNPDRFLDKKYDRNDMHKTMAFGGGKRACTGYQQAMLIACTAIGRLVQEFQWRLEDGEEENVDIVGIINQKLHPMHAIIRPRN